MKLVAVISKSLLKVTTLTKVLDLIAKDQEYGRRIEIETMATGSVVKLYAIETYGQRFEPFYPVFEERLQCEPWMYEWLATCPRITSESYQLVRFLAGGEDPVMRVDETTMPSVVAALRMVPKALRGTYAAQLEMMLARTRHWGEYSEAIMDALEGRPTEYDELAGVESDEPDDELMDEWDERDEETKLRGPATVPAL